MKPLPLAKWDPSLQHVIDDMHGRPLNIHALMAHQPELLAAWWQYRNYVVLGGDLTRRDAELLILRVAVRLGVWYEWASHVDRGLAVGLTRNEIECVKKEPEEADWSARETVLLQAVDELIEQQAIDPKTQQSLAQHFTARQVMDIIAIQGVYLTLACMLKTWDIELDEHVAERLPDDVTRTTFEADASAPHRH